MLDMTLATNFIPGNNLKGKAAGAAWLFLLPNIDLQRTVCVGNPLPSTLNILLSFSQELVLIEPASQRLSGLDREVDPARIEHVSFTVDGTLPVQNGCANLIVLTGAENVRLFNEDKQRRDELVRILAPDGFIYCEGRAYLSSRMSGPNWEGADAATNLAAGFWLTPLLGEMHTAVPLDDPVTTAYFLQNTLNSPMLNLPEYIIKRTKRIVSSRSKNSGSSSAPSQTVKTKSGKRQSLLKRSLLGAGLGMLGAMERAEELVDRKRPVQRLGYFYGGPKADSNSGPPHYLQSIAQESGIRLDGYNWGLSARGEYSSRKMLFYLFDRHQESDGVQPNIVVKMVRDPSFNYRLENEAKSLRLLVDIGLHEPEILPEVLFMGHHAGLAIVGESAIEGVPFRGKTSATADCPFGKAALDWFVDLGAATTDVHAVTPSEIGEGLSQLFDRFIEIYQPTIEQHEFLEQQIARLSDSDVAIPLVFQHGDPGPWNMLVTPQGRVAVLDWEAAEAAGMPGWDLFYFMRSYSLDAARKLGVNNRLEGFTQQFLNDTPLSRLFVDTIARYCQVVGLDPRLVEPLFYTCWMHRSLKEAMRLEPAKLNQGHFVNLIWWCKDHCDSATLTRLFSLPDDLSTSVELIRKL